MFGRGSSVRLARVLGIDITASYTWFFVLFIMIWGLSGVFQDTLADQSSGVAYLTAVVGALLFFVSLTLHELGHPVVARRNGIEIAGIELWFFGGLAKMTRDTDSPGEEFRISAAGPAVTLVIVALCYGLAVLLGDSRQFDDAAQLSGSGVSPVLGLLGWLATVNLFLFLFNIVPAFPLDGGRIAARSRGRSPATAGRARASAPGWASSSPTPSWASGSTSCSAPATGSTACTSSSSAGSSARPPAARSCRAASRTAWRG